MKKTEEILKQGKFDWSKLGDSISSWMEKNPWSLYGGAGGALLGGASGLFNPGVGVGGLLTRTLLGGLLGAGAGWGGQKIWGKDKDENS